MDDILKRLTDYIAKCPSAIGRTFHEMHEEVLIAHSANEIVKLRAALRKIADIKDGNIWGPEDVWVCLDRCVAVAEAALEENP
jgi:hypothetical protein